MVYIRYNDTPIGNFYFSYSKSPRPETLLLTAQMIGARGGYDVLDEVSYVESERAEKHREREVNRVRAEKWLETARERSASRKNRSASGVPHNPDAHL